MPGYETRYSTPLTLAGRPPRNSADRQPKRAETPQNDSAPRSGAERRRATGHETP